MLDQESTITVAPEIENDEGLNPVLLEARRTTPEQLENARWFEDRNREVESNRAIKQALGSDYDAHRGQIDNLSREERSALAEKSAEEIAAYLEAKADEGRDQKRREKALEQQAQERAEANLAAAETPELREVRKAMKSAYQEVASLDKRIAELQRLNELRDDLSAKGWDDLPAERWMAARDGKLESLQPEIQSLIQEKQARLQEAALHQSAYHEASRAIAPQAYRDYPVGQVVGNDGQPVQITEADISAQVQLRLDEQAHQQRISEASTRYADWDQVWQNARDNISALVLPSPPQIAFIHSLPNSADVAYYLLKNQSEARTLVQMPSHLATRELINISHKIARPGASETRRVTTAPKPPTPVSGGASRTFDVYDENISSDEWFRKRNADLERRGKH